MTFTATSSKITNMKSMFFVLLKYRFYMLT